MKSLVHTSLSLLILALLFFSASSSNSTSDSSSSSSSAALPPTPTAVNSPSSSSSSGTAYIPSTAGPTSASATPIITISSASSASGNPGPPVSTLPSVSATRGCDDDSCPDCPLTQQCLGGEQLTMIGRDFCPSAVVELVISQYSSVARCNGYRVARDNNRLATCMLPTVPNSAWSAPAQVYVSLTCPGEESTALFPALTYKLDEPLCVGCTNPDSRPPYWSVKVAGSVGAVILVLAVAAVVVTIRRRRMAARRLAAASGGGVMSSVGVPMYVPLVEQPPSVYGSHPQPPQQQQPIHQHYTSMGAPYSVHSYAVPEPSMYPPHAHNPPYRVQY